MKMFKVGDVISGTPVRELGSAVIGNPPVTNQNATHAAKVGNATWLANKFVISGMGLRNYWYIPDEPDRVSYCVVHSNGAGDAYVISKNYGGCEYHQLYNEQFKLFAFMHVYRGAGGVMPTYQPNAGWELVSKKYSLGLEKKFQNAAIWSFTHIDRTQKPRAAVTSQFIGVKATFDYVAHQNTAGGGQHNQQIDVAYVDDGD